MKEFTDDEKIIARNIDKEYKWMARDKNGTLCAYSLNPTKREELGEWVYNNDGKIAIQYIYVSDLFGPELFGSIKWEDDNPTLIRDIYDPQILNDVERKYIRADLFMNKIAESAFFSAAGKGKIRAAIEKELREDVKPVVHAHWVYGYTFPDGQYRKCSACNELIKAVANDGNFCGHCGAKMDEEDVDQIKRIEAEPEKHAHWVACEDEYEDEYKCSACGGIQFFAMTPQDEGWGYCPECGAKMDEEE